MDSLPHDLSFSFIPQHLFPHSLPASFSKSQGCSCWQQVQLLISWQRSPLRPPGSNKRRCRVADRTVPGLQGRADGREINRSDCLRWNGPDKTNIPHGPLVEWGAMGGGLCSLIQPWIECDNLLLVAKWLTVAPVELGSRRSIRQSG